MARTRNQPLDSNTSGLARTRSPRSSPASRSTTDAVANHLDGLQRVVPEDPDVE